MDSKILFPAGNSTKPTTALLAYLAEIRCHFSIHLTREAIPLYAYALLLQPAMKR